MALGHHVDCLDYTSQTVKQYLDSTSLELPYDIVMSASNEGILDIPVERINEMGAALVINGLPFNRLGISPEPQAPCASPTEVKHVSRFHKKVVWSQWMPELVELYYSGYRQLGIPIISMPYATDITPLDLIPNPASHPECDLLFIGNLKHRAKTNLPIFKQLFALSTPERIRIFGDHVWKDIFGDALSVVRYTNPQDDLAKLYQNASLSPNLHTARQLRDCIQVNDRVFQIAGYKGFQICDTPLVHAYYSNDEVLCTQDPDQYLAWAEDFIRNPEKRLPYIQKAYQKTIHSHSWFNRIAQIQEALGLKAAVAIGDQVWKPFTYSADTLDRRKYSLDRQLYYFCESHSLNLARQLKRALLH